MGDFQALDIWKKINMACSYRATDGHSSESKTFVKKGRAINEFHFSNVKEEKCYLGWCSRKKSASTIVKDYKYVAVSASVLRDK